MYATNAFISVTALPVNGIFISSYSSCIHCFQAYCYMKIKNVYILLELSANNKERIACWGTWETIKFWSQIQVITFFDCLNVKTLHYLIEILLNFSTK